MSVISLASKSPTGGLDHGQLAALMVAGGNLVFSGGEFWEFQDGRGIWVSQSDPEMTRKAETICRAAGEPVTASRVAGMLKLAQGQAYRRVEWDAGGKRDVCARDGILRYEGGQWTLRPYRREDYRRVSLPVAYDPDATCPRFTQFVQEVFTGADDAKERTLALIEMLGLSLTASTEFERAAMLIGTGQNGKSVTLRLLTDMLGEFAAGVNPSELDNRFQRASLDGKLANIITELPEGATLPDAAIKAIISGEPSTVERKHRDPVTMAPVCKLWIGANHLPASRDFSPALFRRFVILGFPVQFTDAQKDVTLSAKLRAEIPGILNVCLAALGRAFDRGTLTTPPSSEDAVQNWRRDVDQVLSFLTECMVRESGARTSSAEAYRLYRGWAEESGIMRIIGRNAFTKRLEAHGWAESGKGTGGTRTLYGLRQKLTGDANG